MTTATSRHPLVWVPSLYFAQGLPFAVVMIMASIMYKQLGISNEEITFWTGLLGSAWVFKPLWSPFLEMVGSKKAMVVLFQLLGGLCMIATALTLHLPGFFTFSVALLTLVAFASATHDIAADGSYISNLSSQQQALYSGWLGAFWNGGKLFVQGGVVVVAGKLEASIGVAQAWSTVLGGTGALLIALGVYHLWAMPRTTNAAPVAAGSVANVAETLKDVIVTFFQKPGIWLAVAFIILFRAGEGQVQTVGRLFLLDKTELGGLGLTTEQMGIAYGTFATLAFIGGSILGGYFAAWRGLKKAMFPLIVAMNLPNLTFWYLNAYQPTDIYLITTVLSIEMLGYGFGFTGLILYIMQVVAPGKYPTAHYALGTGIMQLGFVLFQMMSGTIQKWLGYHDFFIWCVVSAIPVLVLALIVKIPDKQPEPSDSPASAADPQAAPG
ncbi:MFS transporter [Chitinimonas sp. BJYL2]|uniref:MFS transporter n=1 Tax=Chitinimonas sp. BJYL2 TaxID=2976696 RepID=UPI0022B5A1CB|nr:MFS transporter [Chitinimonas sp. BJYL2]